MPVVRVHMWKGCSAERAKAVIQGSTEVFEDWKIPRGDVEEMVHQVPKTHWGSGGVPASERDEG